MIWNKLDDLYAYKIGNNKLFYLIKFVQSKYKEEILIADNLNNIQGILDQLSRIDINFDNESICSIDASHFFGVLGDFEDLCY